MGQAAPFHVSIFLGSKELVSRAALFLNKDQAQWSSGCTLEHLQSELLDKLPPHLPARQKKGVEEKVQQLFDDEKLFRGINAPWKFVGTSKGLKLQNFNETLRQNWPFLDTSIKIRALEGRGEVANQMNKDFDKMLASQFEFLRDYVDGEICTDPIKKAEIWGRLVMLIMHYRLEFNGNKQTLAREALNYIPNREGEGK